MRKRKVSRLLIREGYKESFLVAVAADGSILLSRPFRVELRIRDVARILSSCPNLVLTKTLLRKLRHRLATEPDALFSDTDSLPLPVSQVSQEHAPPIIGGDMLTSEDAHGGNEAVGDVPDSESGAGIDSAPELSASVSGASSASCSEGETDQTPALQQLGSASCEARVKSDSGGSIAEENGSAVSVVNPAGADNPAALQGLDPSGSSRSLTRGSAYPREPAGESSGDELGGGGLSDLTLGRCESTGSLSESRPLGADEDSGDAPAELDQKRGGAGGPGVPTSSPPRGIVKSSGMKYDWETFISMMCEYNCYDNKFTASRFGGPNAIKAIAEAVIRMAKARVRGAYGNPIPRIDVERLSREVVSRRYAVGRCRLSTEPARVWLVLDWSGSMTPLVSVFAMASVRVAEKLSAAGIEVVLLGQDNGHPCQAVVKGKPLAWPSTAGESWFERWAFLVERYEPDFVLLMADSDGMRIYEKLGNTYPKLSQVVIQFHPHAYRRGMPVEGEKVGITAPWRVIAGVGTVPQMLYAIRRLV